MSHPVDLRSALAKLRRAEQYLNALGREIDEFVQDDFYRTETRFDH